MKVAAVLLLISLVLAESALVQITAKAGSSLVIPLQTTKGHYVRTLQNGKRYRLICNRNEQCGWRIDNINSTPAQFVDNYVRVEGGLKINNVQKSDAGTYDISMGKEANPNRVYLTVN